MLYFNEFEPFAAEWLRNLYPAAHVDERSIADVDSTDLVGYRRCHFFAGIAGWEYALQLAGYGDLECWTGSCPCFPAGTLVMTNVGMRQIEGLRERNRPASSCSVRPGVYGVD